MNASPQDSADGPRTVILFASRRLLVRQVARGTGATCFVTFDSYADRPSLDRPGFGEHYFATRGVDAIHVLSGTNRWYQYPELDEALAAIARATAGYPRVVAYGSSMGGFAALTYGRRCGAQAGIALSPQFSVDPRVAPFERRWPGDVRRIAFRADAAEPLPWQAIVYDPRDPADRAHAALFAARSLTTLVEVPHGGHPVGGYIAEVSAFAPLLEGVAAGTLDGAGYAHLLRERRRQSGHYHFTLSRRLPERRMAQKIALARIAAALSPHDAGYWSHLALLLDAAGEDEAARAAHERAVALPSASHHTVLGLVLHHERLGALGEARARVEAVLAEPGTPQDVARVRSRIRRRQRAATPLGRAAAMLRLNAWVEAVARGADRGAALLRRTRAIARGRAGRRGV